MFHAYGPMFRFERDLRAMLGWKLVPDRHEFEEVPLTERGQRVTMSRLDCGISTSITKERVSSFDGHILGQEEAGGGVDGRD